MRRLFLQSLRVSLFSVLPLSLLVGFLAMSGIGHSEGLIILGIEINSWTQLHLVILGVVMITIFWVPILMLFIYWLGKQKEAFKEWCAKNLS